MNKKLIRLTEQDLHRIVKESVNKILMEAQSEGVQVTPYTENVFADVVTNEFRFYKSKYGYRDLKDDEELGKEENINRKNKATLLINDYSNMISFFNPELLELSSEDFKKLFDYKDLTEYKFLLEEIYKNKGHVLSPKEEIIINELESAMNNFEDISSNLLNNNSKYL